VCSGSGEIGNCQDQSGVVRSHLSSLRFVLEGISSMLVFNMIEIIETHNIIFSSHRIIYHKVDLRHPADMTAT
jgi:hypothetical protein